LNTPSTGMMTPMNKEVSCLLPTMQQLWRCRWIWPLCCLEAPCIKNPRGKKPFRDTRDHAIGWK
jgi:hypothetical protein